MRPARNMQSRHAAILERLRHQGRVQVDDLAALLNITPQTVRKDLNALADAGKVMRFHGGAALIAGIEYTGFEQRKGVAAEQKERIGRLASGLIPNNASLFLNAGTTTAAVARNLAHHAGVTIVTDSVNVANDLRTFSGVEVIVPGGAVRHSDGAILGDAAVDFIRQFRLDIAVIGAAAVASDGALLDYDLREASVARAIIESARHIILCVDSSKFDKIAPVRIGQLASVQTLVTDAGAPAWVRQACKAAGTTLMTA